MFMNFKKIATKANVQVINTKLNIESFSNASLMVLTALLPNEDIEAIELESEKNQIESRYAELVQEEQQAMVNALEALGVQLKISKTVTITR